MNCQGSTIIYLPICETNKHHSLPAPGCQDKEEEKQILAFPEKKQRLKENRGRNFHVWKSFTWKIIQKIPWIPKSVIVIRLHPDIAEKRLPKDCCLQWILFISCVQLSAYSDRESALPMVMSQEGDVWKTRVFHGLSGL